MMSHSSTPQMHPIFSEPHWIKIPIGEDWINQFHSFQNSAFRLEILQAYEEPSEKNAFEEYQRGNPVSKEFISSWCDLVSKHVKAGHTMKRVHVVDLPLSNYLHFEIASAYRHTSRAGENIFLLDKREISTDLAMILSDDFWLLDNQKVMIQIYSPAGTLQHSYLSHDPKTIEYYKNIKARVLELSVPFEEWHEQSI
ncbi:MAG: hypothetical protein SGJ02_08895, partial [bacterium]|nr:hypothetical protein [bacterium]